MALKLFWFLKQSMIDSMLIKLTQFEKQFEKTGSIGNFLFFAR